MPGLTGCLGTGGKQAGVPARPVAHSPTPYLPLLVYSGIVLSWDIICGKSHTGFFTGIILNFYIQIIPLVCGFGF